MRANVKNAVRRCFSGGWVDVAPHVKSALDGRRPVIALESALVTHGLPYPRNVETALEMERIVKSHGVVPATIGVVNGRVIAGMDPGQIDALGRPAANGTIKVSRRDLPYALSQGLNGGTTVSGTLVVANALDIRFFVTGGIGGVHVDGQNSLDVSADLSELSRCAIMVVSAGVKSILDVGRTLEYLETVGVCVATYGSDREFPGFYVRQSGHRSACAVSSPRQAAGLLEQCRNTGSGVLLAVPVPDERIARTEIDAAIRNALRTCDDRGVTGGNVTPFVLDELSRATNGSSVETNIALLMNNSSVGSEIAMEYYSKRYPRSSSTVFEIKKDLEKSNDSPVVIGGSNVDYVLQVDDDFKLDGGMLAGQMRRVSGGVGRNVADALARLGHDVRLLSAVGDDANGDLILDSLRHVNAQKIAVVGGESTSWCVVLQNRTGDCMACIGNMDCHRRISVEMIKENVDALCRSPLVVVDGNLPAETMEFVIGLCNEQQIPVYFETTDVAVAAKPFASDAWKGLSFVSPNLNELRVISNALRAEGCARSYDVRVSVGADDDDLRSRIVDGSMDAIRKLICHVPVVAVTLGDRGLLLASRRSDDDDDAVSLVHYPSVGTRTPVSASGAGDCLCAGYVSGVLRGRSQDECAKMGLRAAASALMSHCPVPVDLHRFVNNVD